MKFEKEVARAQELLEKYSEAFEYLEETKTISTGDDITYLRVAINNLLISLYDLHDKETTEKNVFLTVMLLSSSVFFDFFYGTICENKLFIQEYRSYKHYDDAKYWYKFLRNAIVHGYKFDHNQFIKRIFRVDYRSALTIDFELKASKNESFNDFKNNIFYQENIRNLKKKGITWNERFLSNDYEYKNGEIVIFQVEYTYFVNFILNELQLYYQMIEELLQRQKAQDIKMWWEYYSQYFTLLKKVKYEKKIEENYLVKHLTLYNRFTTVDKDYLYDLVEFLYLFKQYAEALKDEDIKVIVQNTVLDKYNLLSNEQIEIARLDNINVSEEYSTIQSEGRHSGAINKFFQSNKLLSKNYIKKKHRKKNRNLYVVYLLKYLKFNRLL